MAVVKWKGKVYSFTLAWQLVLLTVIVLLAFGAPLIRTAQALFIG